MERRDILDWLFAQEASGIKFGLDNTRELLERLGNPQEKFRSVHVAGTNGKGSVSAMVASVLNEAGYSTGLYTSPHLIDFRERIRVSGTEISDEDFLHLAKEVKAHYDEMLLESKRLTFFELTTAIAFAYFAEKNVDIAVVEVGMGGRLDATNIIQPELSIITPISIEHQAFLGNTLKEIAEEKAGIIKEGVPVVSANQLDEILDVLHSKTKYLTVIQRDSPYTLINSDECGTDIYSDSLQMELHTSLIGKYQGDNAALAALAVNELMSRGIYIPDEAIVNGFKKVRWPGRLDVISLNPRIIIDSTHTPAGAEIVASEVERLFGKVTLIFGVLKDKDLKKISAALGPIAKKVFAVSPNNVRSRSAEETAEAFKTYAKTIAVESLSEAVKLAIDESCSENTILITGSLYMAGEAMEVLHVSKTLM